MRDYGSTCTNDDSAMNTTIHWCLYGVDLPGFVLFKVISVKVFSSHFLIQSQLHSTLLSSSIYLDIHSQSTEVVRSVGVCVTVYFHRSVTL